MSRWTRMERRGCQSTLRRMLTGGAVLLALGGTAQAAVFASPPVYGLPVGHNYSLRRNGGKGGTEEVCKSFVFGLCFSDVVIRFIEMLASRKQKCPCHIQ